MKVVKIPTPKKGAIDSYFIAGDWHSHHIHDPSYKILKKASLRIPKKQRRLIINGDFLDCEHLMKKSENFKGRIKRSEGVED